MPKMVHFGDFLKTLKCSQTVLPDRSILIGKNLMENAKIEKLKCDILSNFQTLWMHQLPNCEKFQVSWKTSSSCLASDGGGRENHSSTKWGNQSGNGNKSSSNWRDIWKK